MNSVMKNSDNQIIYKLPLLIKQSREVESDNPTLLPILNAFNKDY